MLTALRKALSLLTPDERRHWLALVPFAFVAAAMESVGAAAVFVLIQVLANPARASVLPVVGGFFQSLAWRGDRTVVLVFTGLLALFYLTKNSVLAAVAYLQNRIAHDDSAALSQRMFRRYLSLPYSFHFRRNSAEIIRNVTDLSDSVTRMVLLASVGIATESLVMTGIVAVLFVTAPLMTLAASAVVFAILALLLWATRRSFTEWGKQELELRRAILQNLQQSLGGIKDVKLMGREHFFERELARLQGELVRILYLHATLQGTPNLLIETVFVCGLLAVVSVLVVRGGGSELVPLLGLYAYAGFRIIPSVNRILMNLNTVRHGAAGIDKLFQDSQLPVLPIDAARGDEGAALPFREELALRSVSYTYDGSPTAALRDIEFTVRRGEAIGVVGPTGAGKSTLIDLILGLLHPSVGTITVDGRDIAAVLRSWQRRIGYVPQSIYLTDDTLRRNVAFGLEDEEIDDDRVHRALALARLDDVITSLPEGIETYVGERGIRLSGGQRQRVAIARALYHDPELLVFDEATAALDNQTERELSRAIAALHGQKTMILIAHRLSTVQSCDRLVFLRHGQIAGVGSFDELYRQNSDFRRMAAAPDEA